MFAIHHSDIMKDTRSFANANTFAIGQLIDVVGVKDMSGLIITAITDSGVHVNQSGTHFTISGHSPCCASTHQVVAPIAPVASTIAPVAKKGRGRPRKNPVEVTDATKVKTKGRKTSEEGTRFKEVMNNFKFPSTPFTVAQIVEMTGLPQLRVFPVIKKMCVKVGYAPRKQGQRGPQAKLFRVRD